MTIEELMAETDRQKKRIDDQVNDIMTKIEFIKKALGVIKNETNNVN